jgi:UDP-3-O-[3-hydroxymyristoyl] glucosamine N-acyltransferase
MSTARTGQRMTLAEIAKLVGGRVMGDDGATSVERVAALRDAEASCIAMLADRRYLADLSTSGAGALLVAEEFEAAATGSGRPCLVVPDAHSALVALLGAMYPEAPATPGVHPTAVLSLGVRLGKGVSVGPYAVLEAGAQLEQGVQIGAHCVVGEGCVIGAGSRLHAHVVLYPGVQLGQRVIIHSGARIGVDGFGYAWIDGMHRKVPQIGECRIGDDVEIGANTCIDRGSIGRTELESDVKIDNLVHLAHNVQVGAHSAMAAQVGIAGSTRVGRGVFFGGQAGVIGHVELGDGARIAAATKVLKPVPAGEMFSGHPGRPHAVWLRSQASLKRLPKLTERVAELQREVEALRARYISTTDETGSQDS